MDTDSIGATQSPGEIAAWNGGAKFTVEDSPTGGPGGKTPAGAVFKGLALTTTATAGPQLLAADVANAKVDIFSSKFAPVSASSLVFSAGPSAGSTQYAGGLLGILKPAT